MRKSQQVLLYFSSCQTFGLEMLGGIQTLRDEQSNLQSLFIPGFPVISVCHGTSSANFLCILSCESEF